jgi:hypothetical protein
VHPARPAVNRALLGTAEAEAERQGRPAEVAAGVHGCANRAKALASGPVQQHTLVVGEHRGDLERRLRHERLLASQRPGELEIGGHHDLCDYEAGAVAARPACRM